jgi:hypothetical protein
MGNGPAVYIYGLHVPQLDISLAAPQRNNKSAEATPLNDLGRRFRVLGLRLVPVDRVSSSHQTR